MTDDLEQLLTDAAPEPRRPAEPDEVWDTARRRARRTAVLAALAVIAVIAVGAAGLLAIGNGPATPHVDPLGRDQPDQGEAPVPDDAAEDPDPHADDPDPGTDSTMEPEPQQQDDPTPPADDSPTEADPDEEPGPVEDPAQPAGEPTSGDWEQHWARLAERSFHTRAYERDGERSSLVDDTTLEVRFSDDPDLGPGIVFHAGCNTHGGNLSDITAERLWLEEIAGTQIGCEEARQRQDDWIRELFLAGPRWRLDGDQLTLTAGTTQLVLAE